MRRCARALTVLALFSPSPSAGCGDAKESSTPVACLEGQDIYLAALAKAPGEVKLAGEAPISDCLAENQYAGDLASVGEAMIEAATLLNGEAPRRAGGAGSSTRLPARGRADGAPRRPKASTPT